MTLAVMEVPGHTLGHIAFHDAGHSWLFCGDTLFAGGCGRLFEGSAEQMHHSLSKLKALEPSTQIYSAHEYTQANVQFALAVEPENQALLAYQKQVSKLRQSGLHNMPSSLEQQLAVNPFLRCDKASVKAAVEIHCTQPLNNEIAVFAGLRSWKDSF